MVAQIDAKYRSYGYRKVLRRLTSYALFEGRPHTTKGQWFNPVVFAFLRALALLPGIPVLDRPIFITGLGRSGTTILGVLLSLHDDVGFLNEPKAIWRMIDPRHDVNGDYEPGGAIYRLGKSEVTDQARNTANKLFGRYLSTVHANRLVDKYPELIFRVEYLLELFPDAKIIFVLRNGIDACHSIDRWSKRLGVVKDQDVEDWWGRNDCKWNYMVDQFINKDPIYESVKAIATKELDHLNRAALEWVITMREGLKQCASYPESIIQVRYEELTKHPDKELKRLLKFCELPEKEHVHQYAEVSLYENSKKPYPFLLPGIDELFKSTMKELGYE